MTPLYGADGKIYAQAQGPLVVGGYAISVNGNTKQFNHPNIVRLFGIGKSHGTRYYAMEYIEGESLDRVMGRRNRMTWEEVVTLGQQLCAALQHARA